MSDNALAAPGRVIRATTKGLGFPRKRQLWAIAIGDDQEAIAHFKWVFPEFEAIEIVGDLSEHSLRDLGLKPWGACSPMTSKAHYQKRHR